MLPEIFNIIGENIFIHFEEKKVKLKNTRILPDSAWKTKHLRLELLRFGHQPVNKKIFLMAHLPISPFMHLLFLLLLIFRITATASSSLN